MSRGLLRLWAIGVTNVRGASLMDADSLLAIPSDQAQPDPGNLAEVRPRVTSKVNSADH